MCTHHQPKVRKSPCFISDKRQKFRLREDRDEGIPGLQAAKIGNGQGASVGFNREAMDLRMAQLEQTVGETDFLHDFHDGWVNRVSPKVTLEVRMRLQQQDRNPPASEEQPQHRTCGACTHDTTVDPLHFTNLVTHLTAPPQHLGPSLAKG